jgi:GH25 family lysozyme M1 (1,4-beta-N-acetylmuramidase)
MRSAGYRGRHGASWLSTVRVSITAGAAIAVAALCASSVWVASGPVQPVRLLATNVSASSASSATTPAPSPAEGHSPQLTQELSGPLTGTGLAQPGSTTHISTTTRAAALAATTTSAPLNGIDISSAQHDNGATIDWADVAQAGYSFAAIKATEGNYYVNPYYASDAAGAVAAGLYVAAYEFANPADSSGTVAAQYTVQNAGNYTIGGQYLPLMLDLEYDPYSSNQCYGLSTSQMVTWISEFVTETTTLTGAAPILYTPPEWWDTCTGNSTAFAGDLLWVPSYSAGAPSALPAGWSNWTMWQYTSAGTVPGITGSVDLDYFSDGPQAEQTALDVPASVQIETLNGLAHQSVGYSATGLPPGLTMSSAGLITGTPTAVGSYQVTVTASSSSAVLPATMSFAWDVTGSITSASSVIFHAGQAGSFTATANGVSSPTFSESGAVPAGVSFSAAGILSGTPASGTGGRYLITITASDAAGTSASQAFTLIVDVPGAALPAGGVLGDITGDGVADILSIDPAGNLWLYPNTYFTGDGMFSGGRSQVGSGWSGYTLAAVADLYGSTSAGLLAMDPSGNLWYYPNTGGTGTGTFGARTQVGRGWNGYRVVGLTDLYGTGKPGILTIDPSGNLWYYANTGGTGMGTFGARSLVGSGWSGYTADVADINGDGSPDILAVDSSGNMWLYPNTDGGTGTGTFGARSPVGAGWSGYRAIDVGLLTGAGPASVLGVDPAGNLWYYPNTGGAGTSTFGTPTQVGTGWIGYRIN